jgi:hypothetical protein
MSDTELVKRLERLERAHRRLKGFALGALVLATALATIYATQPVPNVITAHEFDVVDSSGRVRVRMNVDTNRSAIELYDVHGMERAELSLNSSGEPKIVLTDAQGNSRAGMFVNPSGEPNIVLGDAKGKPRAGMTIDSSGTPSITLNDAQGMKRASMSVNSSGAPSIGLSDAKGFAMDLGSTQTVTPPKGETQQTSSASIVMFGNDQKHLVIWRAPSAVSQSAAEPGKRPRVFIEAWGVPNYTTSSEDQFEKGTVAVTEPNEEMATFALRCPQAIVTIERQKADYVLRLDEPLMGPDVHLTIPGIPFPPLHPTYRSLVFDTEGSQIGTGAELSSLEDSLDGACRTILNSAAPSH